MIPVATYRLQLRKEFDFAAAADIVPYLAKLGISHLYLSPITAARPGSTHGYDVVDCNRLNPELGGEAGFARLSDVARAHGLGIIVDFVPNHMAASVENAWWYDVLRRGQGSHYARYFDIDWRRFDGIRHEAVTLPLLDKPVEQSDVRVEDGHLICNGVRLPLADGSDGDLALQHYKLIRWQDAPRQINYRRFFDINDLVGMNVDAAFDDMHRLVSRLARAGMIDGLRLDHIDGLRDPAAYCERLRRLLIGSGLQEPYLVVEKILDADETLPDLPGVHGTTGYEALNLFTRSFIDSDGLARLTEIWRNLRSDVGMLEDAKRQILEELFPGALDDLVSRLPEGDRQELIEYLVRLPVYRTYVTDHGPSESDRHVVEGATESPALRQALLAPSEFVFRLQQFSGPVMAKSVEDTLFYRDFRLLALNEVGGSPYLQPLSSQEFHSAIETRRSTQPHGLVATATHDTKRGEDARLRIAALSLMAEEWELMLAKFPADPALSRAHQYMLYQALIGAWPLDAADMDFAGRVREFAVKALREGKQESRWTAPDLQYEGRMAEFIERLLLDEKGRPFRATFQPVAERAARYGAALSLAQLCLKTMLPGVPDFYQGSEGWDLAFVDPDNRRAVDYAERDRHLDSAGDLAVHCRQWRTGVVKAKLARFLLEIRRSESELFETGEFFPVPLAGSDHDKVIAFGRRNRNCEFLIAVCRSPLGLERGDWFDFSQLRLDRLPRNGQQQCLVEFGELPISITRIR